MFLLCLRPRPQNHRNVNCNFLLAVKFPGGCTVNGNILFAVKFPGGCAVNCNILLAVKFPGGCAVNCNISLAVKFPAAPGVGLAAGGGLAETPQATVGPPGGGPPMLRDGQDVLGWLIVPQD